MGGSAGEAGAESRAGGETGVAGAGGVSAGGAESGAAGSSGSNGEGGVSCDPGLTSCPGTPACTTDLKQGNLDGTSVTDCGSCGETCSLVNATDTACSGGRCNPSCSTGYDDCNAKAANDGCETDITTVSNCGACAHACSLAGASTISCSAGRCAPACAPHYADCNSDAVLATDDGCEIYLDSLSRCMTGCDSTPIACEPTKVCNSGACVAAQGLVVFTVPFTKAAEDQRYADKFSPAVNLTNATMTLRMYAPGATKGSLVIYLTDADFSAGGGRTVPFTEFSQGWTDITFDVGGVNGGFDPAQIIQVTIEDTSGDTGPWTSPTVIYLDSIRTSNLVVNDTFDAADAIVNMKVVKSSNTKVDGSDLTWSDAVP